MYDKMIVTYYQFFVGYIFSAFIKFRAYYIKVSRVDSDFVVVVVVFHHKIWVFIFRLLFLIEYQISATEYYPIRNCNWWREIVSATVRKADTKGLETAVEQKFHHTYNFEIMEFFFYMQHYGAQIMWRLSKK